MSKLELYNIYAGYEESKPVLKDISFFVEKGEFIVLLGTSGCGKTTILNLIAGMIPISAGELYIDGVKSNDTPPRKRNIAMVFQNYALYPTMTAYENIAFPLQNAHYKKKDIDSSVKSIAVELGIDDLLERKPAEMSGGQQQRVAIARALVRKPSLLLMDEPLSNLDSALRNQLRFEIKKLHKSIGATIVYVTHDQAEALTLASRIILLSNGMIQQIGTPHEVFYEHANEFVATFLGNPKINLFSNCDVVIRAQLHYTQLFSNELVLEELNVKDVNIDAIDIGLRPEDIYIQEADSDCSDYYIEATEFLGDYYVYHCKHKISDISFVVKSVHEYQEGRSVSVTFNIEKLYLFNSISKKNIRIIE